MSTYYVIPASSPALASILSWAEAVYAVTGSVFVPIWSTDGSVLIVQAKPGFPFNGTVTAEALSNAPTVTDSKLWQRDQSLADTLYANYKLGSLTVADLTEQVKDDKMAAGTTVIDFGTGNSDASVIITGQSNIQSTSIVNAWLVATDTPDHFADEHIAAPIKIVPGNIVPNTGFTIFAIATIPKGDQVLTGQWSVAWNWR